MDVFACCQELKDVLSDVCGDDRLEEHECFVLVLMAHGTIEDGKGKLLMRDCYVLIDDLIQSLQQEPKLVGKPKLIFLQCCRGSKC